MNRSPLSHTIDKVWIHFTDCGAVKQYNLKHKIFYYFVEFISRDRAGENTYTTNAYIYLIFCGSLIKILTVGMLNIKA